MEEGPGKVKITGEQYKKVIPDPYFIEKHHLNTKIHPDDWFQ